MDINIIKEVMEEEEVLVVSSAQVASLEVNQCGAL